MNPSSQGLTAGEQLNLRVSGLLEVEPLQFSINGYSEYLHVTIGNNPSTYCILSHGGGTLLAQCSFSHSRILRFDKWLQRILIVGYVKLQLIDLTERFFSTSS